MTRPAKHPAATTHEDATPDAAIAAIPRGPFQNLRRRIALTYEYLGPREVAWRIVTFPLRFTPLRHRLRLGSLAALAAHSVVHHAARTVGAALGSRHAAIPPRLRRRLSLESRATFPPLDRDNERGR